MSRRRYIVAYDIREAGRLRRVHDVVRGFGDSVQYSVFVCDLSKSELIDLRARLTGVVELSEDSVVFIDLGEMTGRGRECFEFLGVGLPLPTGGPTIV